MITDLPTAALFGLCFALAILPVLAFLLALVLLDSYKLVHFRWVVISLGGGAAVALTCLVINPWVINTFEIETTTFTRFLGPLIEEALKGALIAFAIYKRRIGFLVDAAVWGFAIGAGFAAIENTHYFFALAKPNLMLWIIRGFGTAIMHGGATALMAVASKHLADRFDSVRPHVFLPGFLLAAGVHSFFNHFYLSPTVSTLFLLIGLPFLFVMVFRVSETATHHWLGTGFDTDQELLETMKSGKMTETRVGRYLQTLRQQFSPEIVADMICLIRLQLELSIRAKGVLLMKKAGFDPPPDPEVDERFEELKFLQKSIGKTGLIALAPIFSMSSRDLWQFHMMGRR